jgi:carboxymethylenebutenolidase
MKRLGLLLAALAIAVPAFAQLRNDPPLALASDMQGRAGAPGGQAGPAFTPPKDDKLPLNDTYVADGLKASPRHGEWVDMTGPAGKTIKAWIVYPSRSDKAPVVVVIHEIFGMTDWVRGVADRLAADGFIAIAPDMLSGMGPNGGGTESLGSGVNAAMQTLTPAIRTDILNAAMAYGKTMPSSNGKTGVVGFCWGGGTSLLYSMAQPAIGGAVMFYGPAPTKPGTQELDLAGVAAIKAPVLAFYGGNDNRVTSTAQPVADEMKKQGKSFDFHIYDGAAHGFMHLRSEADYKAGQQAWPLVVQFFSTNLK